MWTCLFTDCGCCVNVFLTAAGLPSAVSLQQKLDALQKELAEVQLKYQRELERVERDNKELRKRLLLRANETAAHRKIKV